MVSCMSTEELVEALSSRNLSIDGEHATLLERLKRHLHENTSRCHPTGSPVSPVVRERGWFEDTPESDREENLVENRGFLAGAWSPFEKDDFTEGRTEYQAATAYANEHILDVFDAPISPLSPAMGGVEKRLQKEVAEMGRIKLKIHSGGKKTRKREPLSDLQPANSLHKTSTTPSTGNMMVETMFANHAALIEAAAGKHLEESFESPLKKSRVIIEQNETNEQIEDPETPGTATAIALEQIQMESSKVVGQNKEVCLGNATLLEDDVRRMVETEAKKFISEQGPA